VKTRRIFLILAIFFIVQANGVPGPFYGNGFSYGMPCAFADEAAVLPQDANPGNSANPQDAAPVMSDIHDIRPPEPAGFDSRTLLYPLAGLVIIALLVLGFFLWKRRKRPLNTRIAPSLPPEKTALMALDELSDVEQIEGKVFYFRLSAIMRRYIGERFGINAPEMTTEELLPKMEQMNVERDLLKSLKNMLYSGDMIKFAGTSAAVNRMESDLAFARKFVGATTATGAEPPDSDTPAHS